VEFAKIERVKDPVKARISRWAALPAESNGWEVKFHGEFPDALPLLTLWTRRQRATSGTQATKPNLCTNWRLWL